MSVTISVATEADLNQAIATADAAVSGSYKIVFDSTIVEGTDTGDLINGGTVDLSAPPDLYALNLAPGVSVTIDGAGFTLDGAGAYRGLFVYAGVVTIQDLTIANAHAVGGGGGYNAGGGAGLGGGLFVAGPDPAAYGRPDILTAGAQVTLDDVTFTDDAATGGNGGPNSGVGGGGGLGGAGGLSGGGGRRRHRRDRHRRPTGPKWRRRRSWHHPRPAGSP